MTLPFSYTYKSDPRAHSIKIKIEQGGKVVVVKPRIVPQFIADQFVKKNAQWIVTQLGKISQTGNFNTPEYTHIFGKKYVKKIEFSSQRKIGISVKDETVIFNPTTVPILDTREQQNMWSEKFEAKLSDFLKKTASHYIVERTHILAKKMDLSFNKITLRQQKTRWGSCSSQKALNFNWRLVHFETPIIDYVIIHELSHLVHMDHSSKFWQLVARFDPEYAKHVGWLKRNGLNLG